MLVKTAWILVLIGALNWGLTGLGLWFDTNLNVVNLIFGSIEWLEALVYVLVGLAGVYLAVNCGCHAKVVEADEVVVEETVVLRLKIINKNHPKF